MVGSRKIGRAPQRATGKVQGEARDEPYWQLGSRRTRSASPRLKTIYGPRNGSPPTENTLPCPGPDARPATATQRPAKPCRAVNLHETTDSFDSRTREIWGHRNIGAIAVKASQACHCHPNEAPPPLLPHTFDQLAALSCVENKTGSLELRRDYRGQGRMGSRINCNRTEDSERTAREEDEKDVCGDAPSLPSVPRRDPAPTNNLGELPLGSTAAAALPGSTTQRLRTDLSSSTPPTPLSFVNAPSVHLEIPQWQQMDGWSFAGLCVVMPTHTLLLDHDTARHSTLDTRHSRHSYASYVILPGVDLVSMPACPLLCNILLNRVRAVFA
ncbi:uncharacterized protein PG998_002561 [Apiospora kogelbergensis]|uniref:uncharacterized protein n=1 Tax=Apiospora kogelbergensis TaxID=1337665 RepID=UPI00312FAD73